MQDRPKGTDRDLTDVKEVESEGRFRLLAENAPDIVFRLELWPEQHFSYVRPSAARIVGHAPEEFYASPSLVWQIIHPEDRQLFEGISPESGFGQPAAFRGRHKDGREVWLEPRWGPIRDDSGELVAIEGIARDVTDRKRAEAALRESEERWRSLVENAPDSVFTIDRNGTILFTNRVSRGITAEQAVGTSALDRVSPEYRDLAVRALADVFRTGQPSKYEIAVPRRDGTVTWYSARLGPVMREGAVVAVMLIASNITDRKVAEKALARESSINAALAALARMVISAASVDEVSKAVVEQAMLLTGSTVGFAGYVDPETDSLVVPLYSRLRADAGGVAQGSMVLEDRAGLWGWVLDHRRPLIANRAAEDPRAGTPPAGHVPITRFIGAPAIVNQRLVGLIALANSEADYGEGDLAVVERLASLYALAVEREQSDLELRRARQTAEAANRAKSGFLANMSHELRTPLNAIIGFSQLLAEQSFGPLNEQQVGFVRYIVDGGEHLLNLINDILDLSKAEAGRVVLEPSRFDVATTVKEVLAIVRAMAASKNLALKLEIRDGVSTISADQVRFKQIMFNLLSNAIKFTPDNGSVRVIAEVGWESGPGGGADGELTVRVADSGIGIRPEDRERIFRPFEQVDSSYGRQQQGTGLGLALTRRLVELHGGRIWVESEGLGRGSSFTFVIPQGGE